MDALSKAAPIAMKTMKRFLRWLFCRVKKETSAKPILEQHSEWIKESVTFIRSVNPAEADRLCVEIRKALHASPAREWENGGKEKVIEVHNLVSASLKREMLIQSS